MYINLISKFMEYFRNFFSISLPEKSIYRWFTSFFLIFSSISSFLSLPKILDIQIFLSFLNPIFYFNLYFSIIIFFLPTIKYGYLSIIKFLWGIFLIYILFINSFLMIFTYFSPIQLIIFLISCFLVLTFFNYKAFFFLLILSLIIASLSVYYIRGETIWFIIISKNCNFMYSSLIISALCSIFVRNRTMILRFSHKNQANLELSNKRVSEELLKALQHQKRFVETIDSECVDAFITLHQIGKDLKDKLFEAKSAKSIKEVSKKIITVLNQNKFVANYLLQIIYKVKDHLRLNVKEILLTQFVSNIESNLNNISKLFKNKSKVFVQNESTYETIECDSLKICSLINEGVKYIDTKNKKNNLIMINLYDAHLEYKVSFMKDYVRRIEALKIIISNDLSILDDSSIYSANYEKSSIILPKNIKDLSKKFNENILDAHYGFMDIIYNNNFITQIYVIPKKLRQVRPKVMDIE